MILCFAIFFLGHFATASDSSVCDYSCTPGGGCVVAYVGPSRGGQIQGSCFPESFGGACDGTPLECENCNEVLKNCHLEKKEDALASLANLVQGQQIIKGASILNESNLSEIVDDGFDTMQTPPLGETNTGGEKGLQGSGTDEGKTKGKGGSKDLGSSINKVVGNLDGKVEQGSLKNKVVVEKRNKEGLQVTRGVCRHTCLRGGSCRVEYIGPQRPGATSGSCFSADFGGTCSGTPPECQNCKEEVNCSEGKGDKPPSGGASAGGGGDGGGGGEPCAYECTARGGCTVRYTGPPRGGPSSGSCFPAAFGGACSGTPPECRDCNKARSCKQQPISKPTPRPTVRPSTKKPDLILVQQSNGSITLPDQGGSRPGEPCRYFCGAGGSCKTRYAGPSRPGSTSGACFGDSGGRKGGCFGIPPECRECNQVLSCSPKESNIPITAYPGEAEYCRISPTHTLCQFKPGKPARECGRVVKNKATPELKKALLDLHNNLRAKVARGEERSQPGASNMRQLVWSDELARIAQTWADQCDCVFQENQVYPCFHEPTGGRDRSPVAGRSAGQNIAWGQFGGDLKDWLSRAQGWYDEVVDFDPSRVARYGGSIGGAVTGHYSQFVWADTREVGCGIMVNERNGYLNHYLACDYFPPGNVNGRPVYKQGPACSACDGGRGCNQGLCLP